MLHIFNGDAVVEPFRSSGVSGEVCVFADVLHGGRLMPDPTSTEFTSERILHAVQSGWASPDAAAAVHAAWCRGLASAAGHDEVVLWFEHDLFDQLLLLHHIEWFSRSGLLAGGSPAVSLICIGEFEGVPDFAGLGQLSGEQLASLFPSRQPLSAEQADLGRRAWSAVTGDDPRGVEAIVRGDTRALPFLEGALVRLLEEYPAVGSGLSRTEAQALRVIAEGAGTPRGAFRAQAVLEQRIFLGDASFFPVLRELAGCAQPLLVMDIGEPEAEGSALPDGTVSLTPMGREVLAGRADHAALNGVDRWIGGVQLRGTVPRWRWDPEARGITGPFEADGAG